MPHVHNALHHLTTVQDAYKKAVNEGDPGFNGIERAGETLTPTLDLWTLPEWAFLRRELIFNRRVPVSAAAPTFSSLELVNPTGSGIIAVVEALKCTLGDFHVGVDFGPALGAVATTRGVPCDSRYTSVGPSSVCTVVSGQLAGTVANIQDSLVATNPSGQLIQSKYILGPGAKLFLITAAINTAMTGHIYWRERRAGEEELARGG